MYTVVSETRCSRCSCPVSLCFGRVVARYLLTIARWRHYRHVCHMY